MILESTYMANEIKVTLKEQQELVESTKKQRLNLLIGSYANSSDGNTREVFLLHFVIEYGPTLMVSLKSLEMHRI